VSRPMGDERAGAVAAELAPYAWRDLTDRMLARCVVGVTDRHTVVRFLEDVPGADVGEHAQMAPADPADERVEFLVGALAGTQWRTWSLGRLCAQLQQALGTWTADRDSLERVLRRLLDER
jgi:hypothetical protein